MKSIGLTLKLRPGAYAEYKKRHDELWPEMRSAMASLRIDSIIYRYEELLFVHERAPSDAEFQEIASLPVTPRWNRHMAEVLQTDDKGQPIFIPLPLAFSFGDFT